MNYTITIAREYGSGGRLIAKRVAEILGIKVYDKESLLREALKYQIDVKALENFNDDTTFYFPTMNDSLGADLDLSQKSYMTTLKMIQIIASQENSVIVGRCADHILSDDPSSVLKVFIYAPMSSKIKRVTKEYNIPASKAEQTITRMNRKRKKYYDFITEKEWGTPVDYDMLINSDLGIEEVAEAIASAAKAKFKL